MKKKFIFTPEAIGLLLLQKNIRIYDAAVFSWSVMTPRQYGEYLLRKGVKKWGRNK